jgi:hypothetical protein
VADSEAEDPTAVHLEDLLIVVSGAADSEAGQIEEDTEEEVVVAVFAAAADSAEDRIGAGEGQTGGDIAEVGGIGASEATAVALTEVLEEAVEGLIGAVEGLIGAVGDLIGAVGGLIGAAAVAEVDTIVHPTKLGRITTAPGEIFPQNMPQMLSNALYRRLK